MRCPRFFAVLITVLTTVFSGHTALAASPSEQEAVSRSILHMLDYVSVDYPAVVEEGKVADEFEYREQVEFSAQVAAQVARLPGSPEKERLTALAARLGEAVEKLAPPEEITAIASELSAGIIAAYGVKVAPARAPVLGSASALFRTACASCHGSEGRGDGPLAAELKPRPMDFHDSARQSQRSVYSLYSTISAGVEGTAMRGFKELSEQDRWALAFYVSGFLHPENKVQEGQRLWEQGASRELFKEISDVTNVTPAEIAQKYGADAEAVLSYLRTKPELLEEQELGPLGYSAAKLKEARDAYLRGEGQQAYDAAAAAYLEGFELAEAALMNVDPSLRRDVEVAMGDYRQGIKDGIAADELNAKTDHLLGLLDQAAERLSGDSLPPLMAFLTAFLILLREGVEAILVLAAITAFLVKTERRDALPFVHAGWISAVILGLVTWFVAERFIHISGTQREVSEGLIALFAAAMLIYVGYWLHGHSHAERWKQFIQTRVHGVISGGAVWGLVSISFLAVYREMVETVLFYQTLWLQTAGEGQTYVVVGLVAAAVALVGVAWAILRFSVRLPIKLFFRVNAVLLYGLAVIFAGKGIAALQEAGKLPLTPVDFPRFELLGVYPNLEVLGVQFALCALAVLWVLRESTKARREAVSASGY